MKKILIAILLIIISLGVKAQKTKLNHTDETFIGVKGGINLAWMRFTDKNLSSLQQNPSLRLLGGLFLDIPLTHHLGIAPEVAYVQRGMSTDYTKYYGLDEHYEIKSNYMDLRLPLLYRFDIGKEWLRPYLVAGIDVGYLLGGEITLGETTIEIGQANMSNLYLGAFAGAGCSVYTKIGGRNMQFRLDAVYNHGFMDSFSQMETDEQSTPSNINAYNHSGKRFPKGVEISLGISISLKRAPKDACMGFK